MTKVMEAGTSHYHFVGYLFSFFYFPFKEYGMDHRVKFYSWLIALLECRHLTFEEIANEWRDANANPFGDELDKRTFHRYRENILSQFGISVECDKSDGYRYYVKRDALEDDDVTEWMLSSLRLASLGDMLKYHNKVMLDTPPYNSEYRSEERRVGKEC